ncbi:MAG TPA: hypothetical protein PKD84_02800 [Propionicimonas sp.]|nr:hypothetical protein [Propionicimonas sp.]
MNTSEPHDSIPHSEAASMPDAGAGEHAGRRFIDDEATAATDRASTTVPATPDQQPAASVPDFVPPGYGSAGDSGPQTYLDPFGAAPTNFPPPPPPAAPAPVAAIPAAPASAVPAALPNAYPPPAPVAGQPEPIPVDPGGPERVGRGVLFSLGGIVLGVVATVVLWQLNFIAAFTSLVMAWACIWLYAKGAGRPPRKGVFAVVTVIALGVVLALVSAIASDAVVYANEYFGQPSMADYVDTIVLVLSTPEVWSEYATSIAMYVLFAALGTVGIIMQLARGKQTS